MQNSKFHSFGESTKFADDTSHRDNLVHLMRVITYVSIHIITCN